MADLADATPDLTSSFGVLNRLFNTLTFNPPGEGSEGFLFWASWANHLNNALFATEDAHGPIRRGVVIISCNSLDILRNVTRQNELLGTLIGLLNNPSQEEVANATGRNCESAVPGTPVPAPGDVPPTAAPGTTAPGTTAPAARKATATIGEVGQP
jgi:hypothetical protein